MRVLRAVPWWIWGLPAVLAYSAVLVVGRGSLDYSGTDEGDYLTIAALLSRGVRLYTGVWDNKGALFYYSQAGEFMVAGWRGPFLADIGWVALAGVGIFLLLRAAGTSRLTVAVGTVVYPVMLTGLWYRVGEDVLPVLAPVALAAYFWLRGRAFMTGIVLGIIPFFGPQFSVLYVALIVGCVIARPPARAMVRGLVVRIAAGVAAGAVVVGGAMALRGELVPYVDTMRDNLRYPNRALALVGQGSGFMAHIRVAERMLFADSVREWCFWLAIALFLAAVVAGSLVRTPPTGGDDGWRTLVGLAVASVLATVWTLGEMALWSNHLEIIALPAVLMLCTVVAALQRVGAPRWSLAVLTPAAVVVCLLGCAGVVYGHPLFVGSLSPWETPTVSATAVALDEAAALSSPAGRSVTYARVGGRSDDGSAAFFTRPLTLACPQFTQYYFSSDLDALVRCLAAKRPELIAVAPRFEVFGNREYLPYWDPFVKRVRSLLDREYVPLTSALGHAGVVQVWRLKGAAVTASKPA